MAGDVPLTATDAGQKLRTGEWTSVELVTALIARADAVDPKTGTYVARFDDYALGRAEAADKDFANGVDKGPYQGIPIGMKDILAVAHGPTTANSLVLDPAWGAGRQGPVVNRLEAAGAVITGKLTTSELSMTAGKAPRSSWILNPEQPTPRWASISEAVLHSECRPWYRHGHGRIHSPPEPAPAALRPDRRGCQHRWPRPA